MTELSLIGEILPFGSLLPNTVVLQTKANKER